MADERFVTVAMLDDPVQAEMIRDVLGQAGIVSTMQGAEHRGMLGVVGMYIQIPVQVPQSRAAEAAEIIDALDNPDAEIVEDDRARHDADRAPSAREPGEGPYRVSAAPPPPRSPRLKRVAAFCSLALTFGTGHFYARESTAGFALLAAELLAFALSVSVAPTAVYAVLGLVLFDLIGGLRACDRYNEGRSRSRGGQVALAGGASVAFLGAAVLAGPWLASLAPPPEPELLYPEPAPVPFPYPYPPGGEEDPSTILRDPFGLEGGPFLPAQEPMPAGSAP